MPAQHSEGQNVGVSILLGAGERVISLHGAINLRDIGGYATHSGQMVRQKYLFRSGTLGRLHRDAWAKFRELNLAHIFDLRTEHEATIEPFDAELLREVEYHCSQSVSNSSLQNELSAGELTSSSDARAAMLRLYQELPWNYAPCYGKIFRTVAANCGPVMINCSAGKDRTGVAVALLLSIVGVPLEVIVADYCLSDEVTNFETELVRPRVAAGHDTAAGFGLVASLRPEVRAPLLKSEAAYILASFDAIKMRRGSVIDFVRTDLALSEDEIAGLRHNLLNC